MYALLGYHKMKRFVAKLWLHVNYLLFDPSQKYRYARILIGCWYGLFLAFIFWNYVLDNIGLPEPIADYVYGVLLIALGLGYAFSVAVRCVCLQVCIGFFGKAGRSVLKAVVLGFVIAGPIHNLSMNGKEVIRVFDCSTKLTFNLTKTRYDLMTKPFYNSLMGIKRNASQINDSFKIINTVMKPIKQEIEDDGTDSDTENQAAKTLDGDPKIWAAERRQQFYKNKIRKRCTSQMEKGAEKCKQAFNEAFLRCQEKLPPLVDTILCWPIKISVVCNIGNMFGGSIFGGRDICDPSAEIDENFGANYQELISITSNFSAVKLNYTHLDKKKLDNFKGNVKSSAGRIREEVEHKQMLLNGYLFVIQKLLSLLFLKVIKDAICYHKKYLCNIEFDNVYITKYFKKIDSRRRRQGHHTLLPPKNIEEKYLYDPMTGHRDQKENWMFLGHFCKLLLEMIASTCFVLVDYLMYVGLHLVAVHARIDYVQEGEHIVKITVNGTGIIARLVKKSIAGFVINEHVKAFATNEPCLPRPSQLSTWHYIKIYGTYCLIMFLTYHETYVYRMRRCAMSYFYFSREKSRIIYLYNMCLKKRRGLFKIMTETIEENRQPDYNHTSLRIARYLRDHYPRLHGCLKWFRFFRRKCIICSELETYRHNIAPMQECMSPQCNAVYCEDCWTELGRICLVCSRLYASGNDFLNK